MKQASKTNELQWVSDTSASTALLNSSSFLRVEAHTASGVILERELADSESLFSDIAAFFATIALLFSKSGETAL